jgi:hypothetical protein
MSWLHLPDDLRAEERKAFDGVAAYCARPAGG